METINKRISLTGNVFASGEIRFSFIRVDFLLLKIVLQLL